MEATKQTWADEAKEIRNSLLEFLMDGQDKGIMTQAEKLLLRRATDALRTIGKRDEW